MHCEGGALVFLPAEEPHPPGRKCEVVFAMYTPDRTGCRQHPVATAIEAPPITYHEYMPGGSLSITEPDNSMIDIHHWSAKKHDTWENKRKLRLAELAEPLAGNTSVPGNWTFPFFTAS